MRLQFTAEQKIAIRQLCRSDSQPLPTLFLFLFGYTLFALALFYGWQERYGIAFPIAMLGQYLLYTTMHEAVHLAASPNRAVNWLIGVASATVFFSPFMAFRYVHLKHHRHTNDPIADPDHWSAGSWLLWRWLTQDFYYYVVFFRDGQHKQKVFLRICLHLFLVYAALAWMACERGFAWPLLSWILPARVVITWLGFVFNYIPHYPHDPVLQNSVATDTCARPAPLLGAVLIGQNFHNIHHLYPSAPFFHYAKLWKIAGPELIRNGTVVKEKIFSL